MSPATTASDRRRARTWAAAASAITIRTRIPLVMAPSHERVQAAVGGPGAPGRAPPVFARSLQRAHRGPGGDGGLRRGKLRVGHEAVVRERAVRAGHVVGDEEVD